MHGKSGNEQPLSKSEVLTQQPGLGSTVCQSWMLHAIHPRCLSMGGQHGGLFHKRRFYPFGDIVCCNNELYMCDLLCHVRCCLHVVDSDLSVDQSASAALTTATQTVPFPSQQRRKVLTGPWPLFNRRPIWALYIGLLELMWTFWSLIMSLRTVSPAGFHLNKSGTDFHLAHHVNWITWFKKFSLCPLHPK